MTFVGDILGLLKRPTEAAPIELRGPGRPKHQPTAAETPVTESEIIEALQNLLAERAEAEAVIATAGAKRDDLLLTAGTDDALLAIGRDIDALNLHLERLDRIEQELRSRLIEVRAATAQTEFSDIEAEFESALDEFFAAFRGAVDARSRLKAIRQKVEMAGLQHRVGALELPRVTFPLSHQAIAEFFGNRATPQHVVVRQQSPVYPLEVTDSTFGVYNVGEIIGLPADEGWRWVQANLGRWHDPLRTPPRPASFDEPPAQKPTGQQRLDRVFAAQGAAR